METSVEANMDSDLTLGCSSLDCSCGDSRTDRAWRLWAEDSPRLSIKMSPTLSDSWEKAS